jgi:D-psicose/D-tagatose/L-ribulose 3-epimerase
MIGALRTAGSHLGHFHIGETNRRPPGQGRMPWDEIATGLVEIKYQGRLVMEPFLKMGGQVGQDIRVWRDLSNNADEQELDRQARDAVTFVRQKLASASAGSPVAQRVS